MTESNPWRDKYRRALAEQEKLEKTLSTYQSLMSRTVNSLSRTAEGKDTQLDERLQAIRASVKANDVSGFDRMLKSLDRVVEEADSRQEAMAKDINQQLATIASQLVPLVPEADIKAGVKTFKKQLPKNQLIPAALKQQLQTLNDLQQQMLAASPNANKGLLGRLFNNKDEDKKADTDEPTQNSAENLEKNTAEKPNHTLEGEIVSRPENRDSDTALYRERALPNSMLNEGIIEAGREVPVRAALVMIELLDYFKAVPAVEEQAQQVRKKMSHGIAWFELAPTLEQLRDVVFLSYLSADEEYRDYLASLNNELSNLLEAIGLSVEKEKQSQAQQQRFTDSMQQGVGAISTIISQHQQTDALKKALEEHVHQLQEALTKQQEQEQAEEPISHNSSLSAQLDTLVKKVQAMEANEKAINASLAEERQRAITDTLTGLPNREAYNQKLFDEMQRWQRYKHPLSLAVIDIDFFKKINDGYGHQTGDKVLQVVAHFVSKKLREIDFIARFGGEEFVLILPETTTDQSLILLNRIREKLASTPFKTGDEKITVTVSIGVAEFTDGDSSEDVFARADEALYQAKEGGRNRCCVG